MFEKFLSKNSLNCNLSPVHTGKWWSSSVSRLGSSYSCHFCSILWKTQSTDFVLCTAGREMHNNWQKKTKKFSYSKQNRKWKIHPPAVEPPVKLRSTVSLFLMVTGIKEMLVMCYPLSCRWQKMVSAALEPVIVF